MTPILPFIPVDFSVTHPAKGEEVFQCVVSQFPGNSCSHAINMMNMQVFRGSAVLTGKIIPLQSYSPVAVEHKIVSGSFSVLTDFGAFSSRDLGLLKLVLFLALLAAFLGTGRVVVFIPAVLALLFRSNLNRPIISSALSELLDVLLSPQQRTATFATFLRRACGLVLDAAHNTLTVSQAVASLAVSRKRTGFTPPHVGRSLGNRTCTIWALQGPVLFFFHSLNLSLPVL